MHLNESVDLFAPKKYYKLTCHTTYVAVSTYVGTKKKINSIVSSAKIKTPVEKRNRKIYQLGKAHTWRTFISLTFDDDHYCYRDYDRIQAQFRYLMNKQLPRKLGRPIKYLAVLEHGSKNGRAHYHLLTDIDYDEDIFVSYKKKNRKIMPLWQGGYSDVAKLDGSDRTIHYLMKYLGKEGRRTPVGKREVFTSQKLAQIKEFVLSYKDTLRFLKYISAQLLFDTESYRIYISDCIPQKLWYNIALHNHSDRGSQARLPFIDSC